MRLKNHLENLKLFARLICWGIDFEMYGTYMDIKWRLSKCRRHKDTPPSFGELLVEYDDYVKRYIAHWEAKHGIEEDV